MKIQKITNDKQYKEMLALAETLMNAKKGSAEGEKLDLVVSFIEDYEEDTVLAQIAKKRIGGDSVKVSLEDLLTNSTKENFALTDEDKEWVNMKPVGKEILDDEPWDEFFDSEPSEGFPSERASQYQPEKESFDFSTLNDGHILEALDRTHVSIEFIELSLANHPLIHASPNLSSKVEEINKQLADIYQSIGKINKIEDLDS